MKKKKHRAGTPPPTPSPPSVPPASPPGLESLEPELLLTIVCAGMESPDLLRLSLSCRRVRDVLRPALERRKREHEVMLGLLKERGFDSTDDDDATEELLRYRGFRIGTMDPGNGYLLTAEVQLGSRWYAKCYGLADSEEDQEWERGLMTAEELSKALIDEYHRRMQAQ